MQYGLAMHQYCVCANLRSEGPSARHESAGIVHSTDRHRQVVAMPLSSADISIDADATVWDLVLQHCSEAPWPNGAQKLICTLLQVSKGLQQAVVTQFTGQMHVAATIKNLQQAKSFARWLSDPCMASGGHVISKLWLQVDCGDDNKQAEMLIAAALQSGAGAPHAVEKKGKRKGKAGPAPALTPVAAAPCRKLLVGDFSTTTPSIVVTKGLAAVVTRLTSMSLDFKSSTSLCADWTEESMVELGEAIGRLSSLRDLRFSGYECIRDQDRYGDFIGCDFLVSGLSSLTALTSLDMQEVATTDDLPVQLKELTYNCFIIDLETTWSYYYLNRSDSPVFAELTALTKLTFNSGTYIERAIEEPMARPIVIVSMPPNLLELCMPGISSNETVLQCRHLTRLVLEDCKMEAEGLQELTSLSDLREMRLSHPLDTLGMFHNLHHAAAAAEAWKWLPLKSLKFEVDLHPIIKHDAESDVDPYTATSSSSHDCDLDSESRSRNIILLNELALQTGLTCLELNVYVAPPGAPRAVWGPRVFDKLGLLHATLQHLTNLRELHLGVIAEQGYHYRTGIPRGLDCLDGPAVERKTCEGHALLCRVIAALPDLTAIKLHHMPNALVQDLRMQLLADNRKVKLCVNPEPELDAD